MVKPGGLLVYAVCSLRPEEGPQRIHALVTSDDRVERLPLTPDELPGLTEALTPEGDLRSLPFHLAAAGGLSGFYACRLPRRPFRPCRLLLRSPSPCVIHAPRFPSPILSSSKFLLPSSSLSLFFFRSFF